MRILVLLSGGIDSAALVGKALQTRKTLDVGCLFVDYGQPSYVQEGRAAYAIAGHFTGVTIGNAYCRVSLGDMATGTDAHVVPARNLVLLALGANYALSRGFDEVWLGAISEDYLHYADCRLGFAKQLSKATSMLGVAVKYPWVEEQCNKAAVLEAARAYGVPLKDTYSCYGPAVCHECPSCLERAAHL